MGEKVGAGKAVGVTAVLVPLPVPPLVAVPVPVAEPAVAVPGVVSGTVGSKGLLIWFPVNVEGVGLLTFGSAPVLHTQPRLPLY